MVVGPAPVGMTRDDEPRVVGMDAGRCRRGRCEHLPVFVGMRMFVFVFVIVGVVVRVIVGVVMSLIVIVCVVMTG